MTTDIALQIIELDKKRAKLSFQIKNALNPVNVRDLELIQERDKLKAEIDMLASQLTVHVPDYTPLPRMEKMVINPRDLVAEHNTRYNKARLAVSMLKLEYKWQGTYYDPIPPKPSKREEDKRHIVAIEIYKNHATVEYSSGKGLYINRAKNQKKYYACHRLANSDSFETTRYVVFNTDTPYARYELKKDTSNE